jgi:hypothetical protein
LMAKYGVKTLNYSIYGGNIPMMMRLRFIIWIRLVIHDRSNNACDELIQSRSIKRM